MKRILFLAALLLPLPATVRAATYHADSVVGNDANDGRSAATAWRSLSKINATAFQPGDRLLLRCGSVWTGILHPRGSGSATKWITLESYGEGPKPIVHGGDSGGGAVLLENQQYWSLCNLEITNHGSAVAKKAGILIRNHSVGTLSGIEVRDCSIHDVAGDLTDYRDGKESGGIVFCITAADLSLPSRWEDVRVENNSIHDVARNGILMQSQWINKPADPNSSWRGHGPYTTSTRIRIAGNRLERIGGDGIVVWCAKGATVERNFVRQANNNTLKQGHAGIWPYFCEDVVFQYNEVCETKTKFDGMAFDFDNGNQRCVYQYNYSHDNEGGFLNMCCDGNGNGNIARYNVSQNDGCLAGSRVFLVHGQGNHGYQVYNNTIYAGHGNPAIFEQGAESSGSSIAFKNNIFVNAGSGTFLAAKGCRFERNLYFGTGQIAGDAGKILADPGLLTPGSGRMGLDSVAGYQLTVRSAALRAGLPISGNGGSDFWGNRVSETSPPHVGAYNGRPVSP
jgi:hypothetical protein